MITSGLLNDFTKALGQQLYYWGCDVEHTSGNLLSRFGFIKTESEGKKSTSCYRLIYNKSLIELHGLCVGCYSDETPSFLYTRGNKRCSVYLDSKPPLPGHYNKSLISTKSIDEIYTASQIFLDWWLCYENWIIDNFGVSYRQFCYDNFRKLPNSKAWLKPDIGQKWLQKYKESPQILSRSSQWKKSVL